MVDNFYRAFEDRYRGSRDLIKSRLQAYRPFIGALHEALPDGNALDLGCGRGEWLEVISSAGFRARGVDLDDGMLEACRELGLDATHDDALSALRALPDAGVGVVSAFHVVEHISFEDVRTLVSEALRVLVPGGLLILETPNPENVVVAGERFYMDPSHVKPLPPPLLGFAVEYAGFERVKIVRLQEPESLHHPEAEITLLNVLEGVSPDYAVVAQKLGDEATMAATAAAFEAEYGLTLPGLATRHNQHLESRLHGIETRLQATQELTRLAEAKAMEAQREAQELQSTVKQALDSAIREVGDARLANERVAQLEARVQTAEAKAHQLHLQLEAVHASTSWRITAPLRRVGLIAQAVRRDPVKISAKQALRHAARYVNRRPWLAKPALRVLGRFPHLKLRLARAVSGLELHSTQSTIAIPSDAAHLTPHARQIYANLRSAVGRREKGDL
ncbi:O-antigen chain-terminating methyltransferase [Paraburkholderia eburnea]|uniref:O-antigen chain-terminating methyltransferase n=1 Tax=Paraburkholderia eburnea TaxID=1189126 RepID=A0A2S4MME0_9BURK|nr:class I SAM-dependent methyltransferase [Paraburkholderia eburnea]POR55916.1 O-antigen chain-terminating methyltransferase [Paraburkholderia eburnea]PRZ27043.1 O-antigen chain-terminating methyltransferase [Paraburkholderia eburnea]